MISPTSPSAPHLTKADFSALDAILEAYSEELRRSHVGRSGELDTLLHHLLYRHAGRPRRLAIVDQLLQSTDRFIRMQLYYTDGRARAEHEHAKIVRLCAAGKHARAARVLRDHIENAGEKLAARLRSHQTRSAPEAR